MWKFPLFLAALCIVGFLISFIKDEKDYIIVTGFASVMNLVLSVLVKLVEM